MKYSELIEFEPLTTVIRLADDSTTTKINNVKNYVFSERMVNVLKTSVVPNLRTNGPIQEQKGISVVGSYGTGKSHLMSVISSIAEDADLLQYLTNQEIKEEFSAFAGKYKVLRFEIGNTNPLFAIICSRVERYLNTINIDFHFNPNSMDSYKEQFSQMMAAFEQVYPDKYFLIVIDELLEYLRGRDATQVNVDLMTLRQLGELCNNTRFKLIYGVQELLYNDPLLTHAAEAVNHANDRFSNVLITKEDVSFVVKNRLLKKSHQQIQQIKEHLSQFAHLFDGISQNLNEYAELFPLHPSYITHFQQIKYGKDTREILKVLTQKFETLQNKDIPEDNPGLITYDTYFDDLRNDTALLTIPDISTIKEKAEIIEDKINTNFNNRGDSMKKPLAKRIVAALAICALGDDLNKHLGASAKNLKEDLCFTTHTADTPELLTDTIAATIRKMITATQAQYLTKDDNSDDYYIRTEGGINVEQIIKEYADYLSADTNRMDQYFFNLLQRLLGIETNPYRTGFKIWEHQIEWLSTKSFRLGYIFFGNPNERSTTQPLQEFYIYFCPLFSQMDRTDQPDEIYFDFSQFTDNFKEEVRLYAASEARCRESSTENRHLFESQIELHYGKVKKLFNEQFVDKTQVIYNGTSNMLRTYQLPQEGDSKLDCFSSIASILLDQHFNNKFQSYPHFMDLLTHNTKENLTLRVKNALKVILNYNDNNRDGHAILRGLGLVGNNSVEVKDSLYANNILKKLRERGEGQVLNRDDILYPHYLDTNQWYSADYKLEYQLEFVVLAALVYCGDIEISWAGNKRLRADNIDVLLLNFEEEDYFSFRTVSQPAELPVRAIKQLFKSLNLPDLSNQLQEPTTISRILTAGQNWADKVVQTMETLENGLTSNGIPLLDTLTKQDYLQRLQNFQEVLNGINNIQTSGQLRHLRYTEDELKQAFSAKDICDIVKKLKDKSDRLNKQIAYLNQARSYILESEPLLKDIEFAINDLPRILVSEERQQKQYEAQLNALIDNYAEYYYNQYTKNHIKTSDINKKNKLLNSSQKHICDILKDIFILNCSEYNTWCNTLLSLKEGDANISLTKIKEVPYHNFNPRESSGIPMATINQLAQKLDEIVQEWCNTIKNTINDPTISARNFNMLSAEKRILANNLKNGTVEINEHNAKEIRDIVNDLAKGFDVIELSLKDISSLFIKPFTMEEASESFNEFLKGKARGRQHDRIRIILSDK